MSNPLIFPVILQIIGVFVVMAEVILPSAGLLTFLALALFGYSLYSIFSAVSSTVGFGFAIADLVIIPAILILGIKFLARSPVTLKKELSSSHGVKVQNSDLTRTIGQTGVAKTDLRPSGIASINGERFDVVTEGKYLDKDTPIIVISVTGNQIIVKENPKKGDVV